MEGVQEGFLIEKIRIYDKIQFVYHTYIMDIESDNDLKNYQNLVLCLEIAITEKNWNIFPEIENNALVSFKIEVSGETALNQALDICKQHGFAIEMPDHVFFVIENEIGERYLIPDASSDYEESNTHLSGNSDPALSHDPDLFSPESRTSPYINGPITLEWKLGRNISLF